MTAATEFRSYHHHKRSRETTLQRRFLIFLAITFLLVWAGVLLGSGFSAAAKSNAANARTAFKYYTSIQVEEGDSLWSIAGNYVSAEYGSRESYIEEVTALNHLSDTTIHAGQYLTVPYYSYDYK